MPPIPPILTRKQKQQSVRLKLLAFFSSVQVVFNLFKIHCTCLLNSSESVNSKVYHLRPDGLCCVPRYGFPECTTSRQSSSVLPPSSNTSQLFTINLPTSTHPHPSFNRLPKRWVPFPLPPGPSGYTNRLAARPISRHPSVSHSLPISAMSPPP